MIGCYLYSLCARLETIPVMLINVKAIKLLNVSIVMQYSLDCKNFQNGKVSPNCILICLTNLATVHQVPITAGCPEGMWFLRITGGAGIEPYTPRSWVQHLNRSATRSTWKDDNETMDQQKDVWVFVKPGSPSSRKIHVILPVSHISYIHFTAIYSGKSTR